MPTMRIGQADRNCQRQQGQPFPVCLPPTGEDTRKDDNKQLHACMPQRFLMLEMSGTGMISRIVSKMRAVNQISPEGADHADSPAELGDGSVAIADFLFPAVRC